MTDITMALKELLRSHELDIDSDFLRDGVQVMMQMLIELEAGQQIGAGRYEHRPERVTHRNGRKRCKQAALKLTVLLSLAANSSVLTKGLAKPTLIGVISRSHPWLVALWNGGI